MSVKSKRVVKSTIIITGKHVEVLRKFLWQTTRNERQVISGLTYEEDELLYAIGETIAPEGVI